MAALKYFTTPLPTPSSARGIRVGVIIVSHIPTPASGASRYSVIMKIRASFVFIILVTIWSSADSHKLQAVCQTWLLWVYCYQIFSIPILGQKRTAEDEKLKLTGQKRTQTAQKTKISKLGDCAVGDGTRVCGGRWQVRARSVPSHPSHSGRVIETFVFGIVKVCEDGKMVLKRRTDIDEDFKLRNFDKRGRKKILRLIKTGMFTLSRLHMERSSVLRRRPGPCE